MIIPVVSVYKARDGPDAEITETILVKQLRQGLRGIFFEIPDGVIQIEEEILFAGMSHAAKIRILAH